MRIIYLIFLSILSVFVSVQSASAQGAIDSRGKDFWLTFMPNFHGNAGRDTLYIYIAASKTTTGVISYTNRNGNSFQQPFSIVDSTQIYTFKVPWNDYELIGFMQNNIIYQNNQVQVSARQSFHVTADEEVSVYALSQAVTTSDAFLVLPTDALGADYFVMSYNSDGTSNNGQTTNGSSTPSQFSIIATEDNTDIHIVPTAPTYRSGMNPIDITLMKGEVYLVQAAIAANYLRGDLTGTRIKATKPVAVFGGHQRSKLPVTFTMLGSRDFLCEQMPPVNTWGKNYFVTPYPQPGNMPNVGTDLIRVIASVNNTVLYLNGTVIRQLNAGQFYEMPLTAAGFFSATEPILVAQFKQSSQVNGGNSILSDPFMMIIPPREQYLRSYRCTNAQAYESNATDPTYFKQYMTVIIPKDSLPTLRIDGSPVSPLRTGDIPAFPSLNLCIAYTYAWIEVPDGVHTVEAGTPFGLLVYGYGFANSYGYVGGMALNNDLRTTAVVVQTGSDTTICSGGAIQLIATGGDSTYWWSPPDGLSCLNCPNPIATPSKTTTYKVHSVNDGGCDITDSITVRVHTGVIDAGSDKTICAGDSAQLTPSGGVAYIWSPVDGLSCAACSQPYAKPLVSTTYYAIGVDSLGCMATDSVKVLVNTPMANAGNDTATCKGGSVQLTATGGNYYQWSPPDGLSCTSCASPIASPLQTTTYTVVSSLSPICSAVDSVTVRVMEIHPEAGNDTTICRGTVATLHASGGFSYEWSPPDGLSCTNCADPIATPQGTTTYHLLASAGGCFGSDSVTVTVSVPTAKATGDTMMCLGSAAQLTGSGGVTYAWSPATGLSCTTCPNPIATPQYSTKYYLTTTNAFGCEATDSVRVRIRDCSPTIVTYGSMLLCDSMKTPIWIRNREDVPVQLLGIFPTGTSINDDGFTITTPQLPYTMQPYDSVEVTAHFRPRQQRAYSAAYRVFTSNDSLQTIELSGGGDFAKVFYSLNHDTATVAGNLTFPLHLSARCDNWNNAKIYRFMADLIYGNRFLAYDSVLNYPTIGAALDNTWSLQVEELPGKRDERILRITGQGTTPMKSDGVLLDMSIGVLLADSLTFSPGFTVSLPDRPGCIELEGYIQPVILDGCFAPARLVRFSSTGYSLAVKTIGTGSTAVDFAVGLSGRVRLDLYNSLGELVRPLLDQSTNEGTYRLALPDDLPAGFYAVKMQTGVFTDVKTIVIVR